MRTALCYVVRLRGVAVLACCGFVLSLLMVDCDCGGCECVLRGAVWVAVLLSFTFGWLWLLCVLLRLVLNSVGYSKLLCLVCF